MIRAAALAVLLAGALLVTPAIASDDAFSDACDAADAGNYKKALHLFHTAYEHADSQKKKVIAAWVVQSALMLGDCDKVRAWLPRADRRSLKPHVLHEAETRCRDTPPPPPPSPEPVASGCADGRVLTEDKAHCCPVNTELSADKTQCLAALGTLIVDSNLSGALLTGVPNATIADGSARVVPLGGFHLPNGEVKLTLPAGTYALSLKISRADSLGALTRQVVVPPKGEARASFDWAPQWKGESRDWADFAKGNGTLTPSETGRNVGALVAGLLALGGSATLYGTCGANVNRSCGATWQKGLSYTGATVVGLIGLPLTMISAIALGQSRMPPYTDVNGKALPR